MRYLQRQGELIGYRVIGDGPAVMLCHGLLGDGRLWDGVLDQLSGCQIIIPDLRGHRHSTGSKPFTMWDVADDLLAIAEAMDLSGATLAGFSMGGMAAMRAVIKSPDRFDKLALVSTSGRDEPRLPRLRSLGMAALVSLTGPLRILEPEIKRLMFAPEFRKRRPDVVETEMRRIRERPGKPIARAVNAVFSRDNVVAQLEAVKLETLVLVGEKDITTPPRWSEELATHIPNSELVKLPGVGHMTPLEAPTLLADRLDPFVRG